MTNGNDGGEGNSGHREPRRNELTATAYRVIAERGFEGLRVREVAGRAGVNIATLHYYFATKEALIEAVVQHVFHLFISVTAPGPSPATAAQEVRQLFRDLKYQLQVEPDMFTVINELHLRAGRDRAVAAALEHLNGSWHAHVKEILAAGVREGSVAPHLDPGFTASILIALVKGISLQVGGGLDTFDLDSVADHFIHWLQAKENSKP